VLLVAAVAAAAIAFRWWQQYKRVSAR